MSMRSVFGLEALGISGRVLRKTALAICLALKSLVVLAMITHASAQAPSATEDINDTTVGIVSGTVTGTYVQFASDLSNVLDDPGKMRVLALLGKGSMQNVEDILKVRGVDLGIVQSDVLAYIRKRGLFPGTVNKLQYVTKLYNEEFHLLTGNDINTIE
ncbi:MAG TPA: TAXI family TRAP transporter solute-binding subunit, partial [Hyphomicrobiales bacterium]|nr:TAXI family TRAP transporter solute-binding subunit [Hyphomicrobiales bacterium]